VFFGWLSLLSLTEIGPASGWHSLWLVGLLSLSSVGLYAMSNRYANPFAIKSRDSTQTPLISIACKETELALEGVFSWHGRLESGAAGAAGAAGAVGAVGAVAGGRWLGLPATRSRH